MYKLKAQIPPHISAELPTHGLVQPTRAGSWKIEPKSNWLPQKHWLAIRKSIQSVLKQYGSEYMKMDMREMHHLLSQKYCSRYSTSRTALQSWSGYWCNWMRGRGSRCRTSNRWGFCLWCRLVECGFGGERSWKRRRIDAYMAVTEAASARIAVGFANMMSIFVLSVLGDL